MSDRPFVLVLAGVNGAGKSSVLGSMLNDAEIPFFNPDSFAKKLIEEAPSYTQEEANSVAWNYGFSKLEEAVNTGTSFAFETTLGGHSICAKLIEAATTHDVKILYCGLDSAEAHIHRVQFRVVQGGHDIPEQKIRQRWESSRLNLVKLLPYITDVLVFDNSVTATLGEEIPEPIKLLEIRQRVLIFPSLDDVQAMGAIKGWAKPLVMAGLDLYRHR